MKPQILSCLLVLPSSLRLRLHLASQPALADAPTADIPDEGVCSPSNILSLANQWAPSFKYLGLFAFLVWGSKVNKEVRVWLWKDQFVDLVATWAPWLLISADGSVAELPIVELVACRLQSEGDGSCVSARMCQGPGEISGINHVIPLVDAPWGRRALTPQHPPCNGGLCAQVGDHCMAALLAQTAAFGKLPVRSVADGNCAPDTMLFLSGRVRTELTRKCMRLEVVKAMREYAGDRRWEEVCVGIEGVGMGSALPAPIEPIIIDDPQDPDSASLSFHTGAVGSSTSSPASSSSGHLASKAESVLSASLAPPTPITDQPVEPPRPPPVAKPALAAIATLVAQMHEPAQANSTEQPEVPSVASPSTPLTHQAAVAGPAFAAPAALLSANSKQHAVVEALPLPASHASPTSGREQLEVEAAILKKLGLNRLSPSEMKMLVDRLSPEVRQGLVQEKSGEETETSTPKSSPKKRKDENFRTKHADSKAVAAYAAQVGVDAKQRIPCKFWDGFFQAFYGTKTPTHGFTRKEKMYWKRRLREAPRLRAQTECGKRQRATGGQGRPIKAVAIEEELIQWFAAVRRLGARVAPPDSKLFLPDSDSYFRIINRSPD